MSSSDVHPPHPAEPTDLESDLTVIGSPASIAPSEYPHGLTVRELGHALRGEMLNHFLLQECIGGGGMGVVFKALDTTLDRIVAVKVVASHRVNTAELQRRFLIEAQSTARLDHPNIARIHYIGRDRGLPYIVFEYIDGVNVRDHVAEQGPLAVEEAISYAYQIAHALAHAYSRGVVHRDIKPSNILVTDDGEAKLVDMGLARLRQLDDEDEDLTATGITLGTFDYISPEQARDAREADCRSDIYSLGCTLFYMLTARAPFAHGTAVQKLLQHQSEPPPALSDFRSDVPDSVVALVKRMLAKNPNDRQQTPLDLVVELAAILTELGVRLPHALAPMTYATEPPTRNRRRRHLAWLVPTAAVIVIALLADNWQSGAAVTPFPPLRGEVAASTKRVSGQSTDEKSSVAPQTLKSDEPSPLTLPSPPASAEPAVGGPLDVEHPGREPFELGRQWDFGNSLWLRLKNGPAGDITGNFEPTVSEVPQQLSPSSAPVTIPLRTNPIDAPLSPP